MVVAPLVPLSRTVVPSGCGHTIFVLRQVSEPVNLIESVPSTPSVICLASVVRRGDATAGMLLF